MITGDHLETAKVIARQVGIITEDLDNLPDDVAMTGKEFRKRIGAYSKIWNEQKQQFDIMFNERSKFDSVKKNLKVIARATPEDKLLLICGIGQRGGVVGMAGDGISDAEALKTAHVGICMGSGCDVAKDNSDLVILDNDFASI